MKDCKKGTVFCRKLKIPGVRIKHDFGCFRRGKRQRGRKRRAADFFRMERIIEKAEPVVLKNFHTVVFQFEIFFTADRPRRSRPGAFPADGNSMFKPCSIQIFRLKHGNAAGEAEHCPLNAGSEMKINPFRRAGGIPFHENFFRGDTEKQKDRYFRKSAVAVNEYPVFRKSPIYVFIIEHAVAVGVFQNTVCKRKQNAFAGGGTGKSAQGERVGIRFNQQFRCKQ